MSCGGCGCCPKCGCRATCTCNRNIFSLESQTDFSYATGMSFTVADESDGQLSTAQGQSQSCYTVAGEKGGKCVNCGWNAPGFQPRFKRCPAGTCAHYAPRSR